MPMARTVIQKLAVSTNEMRATNSAGSVGLSSLRRSFQKYPQNLIRHLEVPATKMATQTPTNNAAVDAVRPTSTTPFPDDVWILIFKEFLRDEDVVVTPYGRQRFRNLHASLRLVCRQFYDIASDRRGPLARPSPYATWHFEAVRALYYVPKMSLWLGLSPSINLTQCVSHLTLHLTGDWESLRGELEELNHAVTFEVPQLETLRLCWRPTFLQYCCNGQQNHLLLATLALPSFRGDGMTIAMRGICPVNITLCREPQARKD
jgi:hypothetical protein